MSDLEKLPLFFVNIETFVNMYKENENINLKNIIIIADHKIPLCQVFYPEKKIIPQPYSVMVTRKKMIKWRQKVAQL